MPNCMICKEPVASGLVLCGACAGDYVALDYFIDRLAEDIVLSGGASMCGMCVIGGCDSQVSGMTCRNGVKTWLLNRKKQYAADMPAREARYFALLDDLRLSGCDIDQARKRLEEVFPHLRRSAGAANALIRAWQNMRTGVRRSA